MAVPLTGTLLLEELAREAYYGEYGGDPTTYPITPPIFLYDLVNGGNSAGSGMFYPTINASCSPNPLERISVPLLYMLWEDTLLPGEIATIPPSKPSQTLYVNKNQAITCNWLSIGDQVYLDSAMTIPASTANVGWDQEASYWRQNQWDPSFTLAQAISSNGWETQNPQYQTLSLDSSGVITSVFGT